MVSKTKTRASVAARVRLHAVHPRCRPGKTAHGTKPLKLHQKGRWVRDDGSPGLAFIGMAAGETDPQTATVWVANCNCEVYLKCPLAKALAYAGDRYEAVSVERRRQTRGRKVDRVNGSTRRPRRRT